SKKTDSYNSTFGRRSILECDINPYELISSEESGTKDSSITFVNGQRIRVRPTAEQVYEDVQVRQSPTKSTSNRNKPNKIKSPISSPKLNEKESEHSNRFKSILKKPTTFSDTDSNGPERSPSPSLKSGSHFYIPMPCTNTTPRKKVQFLVENELVCQEPNNRKDELNCNNSDNDDVFEAPPQVINRTKEEKDEDDKLEENKICTLRRSYSERITQEQKKVIFNDTMALRHRRKRANSRINFDEKDLERLDGITSRTRKISPSKTRPNVPPPPPPLNNSTNEFITEADRIPYKEDTIDNDNKISVNTNITSQNISRLPSDTSDTHKTEGNISLKTHSEANNIQSVSLKEQISLEKLDQCIKSHKPEREFLPDPIPPSAPPRKRSNNKQPQISIIKSPSVHTVRIESPPIDYSNKTVVQIKGSPAVHKIQIKNEFSDTTNVHNVSILESPQRKTSILINGDDCYSTVNVNDDIPLYQSSVVVNDSVDISPIQNNKKSSTVYITGTFISAENDIPKSVTESKDTTNVFEITNINSETIENNFNDKKNIVTKDYDKVSLFNNETHHNNHPSNPIERFDEKSIPSSELLKELLRDPVEAVRHNLVPHVCGKSDVSRRPRDTKLLNKVPSLMGESLFGSALEENKITTNTLEESFLRLRNYESVGDDVSSEHSSSTQYELMDPGSDCYTDHSNRSSVTEEELSNRTKFYELLAESAAVEVSEHEDHHYESIKVNSDPIYEEIEVPPPLPTNPPPSSLLDDLNLDKEFTTRSIFEGASKYDILSYLVDAKERGIVQEDSYNYNFGNHVGTTEEETKEAYNRVSQMSTVSDSSEDNSLTISGALIDEKATCQKAAEIERNDSGVGSETSKSSLSKYRSKQEISLSCEDCEVTLEIKIENEPLICRKCIKKRSERKEIITEIVETEEKYSRDLQIILEEFYQPMLVAGLLTPEQLSAIFLNAEELLENSQALAERLRDAVEIALEQGDDDLLTVNIGKLFLEAAPMLHAFETYCIRQGAASLLLANLEKEKELLRIFLRVSQMENTMLRRMNLNSFLMVPVQRVTKYPLLLARLFKVTPPHHDTREQLKEAQHKIELHLNHMNSETKDVPSKLWRRIGSSSGRRSSAEMDLVNIKLRKIAVDVLEWNHEEAKFALEGRLLFTQPTDNNWRKGRTIKLSPVNALLVTNGKPLSNRSTDRNEENGLIFAKHGAREAALLLVRDKNGRYSLLREPLYLDRCVIAADPAWQSYFEVQELLGKDTFIFKAEDEEQTKAWYKQLQFYAQGMGAWRKRRNALANIMINGMGLRS
ncbi:hypothetical protein NQ314_010220, partial [Rhamnusium bicolor]